MAITITGASGSVVSLQNAVGRDVRPATQMQNDINTRIANGTAEAFDLSPDSGNPTVANDVAPVGIITDGGDYQIPNLYQYLVVADDEGTSTGAVTLNSNGFAANTVNILAGRQSGLTYNAGNEAGQIINTVGNFTFNGEGKTGAWTIYTGQGNSTVTSTNGNNQINTGMGASKIVLGTGNNNVYSQGQDTITGGGNGYQSVSLLGSQSEVVLGNNTLIADIGSNNSISVGDNSTVNAGMSSNVSITGGYRSVFQGGSDDTVSATASGGNFQIVHGSDNTYTVDGDVGFLNGNGNTSITTNGQAVLFGASDSNYTLNASGSNSGLFVAGTGNETLNASGSTSAMQIYANTVAGGQNNFVATGGSGDDLLVAGTGDATFTGGGGNNLFAFTKDTSQGGNTVITDFANNSQNKIGLFGYGLNEDSFAALLNNSQNDGSGNAVLNVEGHTITIQGVSVADLNTNQFEFASPQQTA